MPTISLVTPVFMSKADALALLSERLGLPWITDDPSDVTLPLRDSGFISIEVPHYGEELPLTLEVHHPVAETLDAIATELQASLRASLEWETLRLG